MIFGVPNMKYCGLSWSDKGTAAIFDNVVLNKNLKNVISSHKLAGYGSKTTSSPKPVLEKNVGPG